MVMSLKAFVLATVLSICLWIVIMATAIGVYDLMMGLLS